MSWFQGKATQGGEKRWNIGKCETRINKMQNVPTSFYPFLRSLRVRGASITPSALASHFHWAGLDEGIRNAGECRAQSEASWCQYWCSPCFCDAFLMFQCGRKAHAFFVHSKSLLVNSGSGSLKLPLLSQFLRSQTHKSTESKVNFGPSLRILESLGHL